MLTIPIASFMEALPMMILFIHLIWEVAAESQMNVMALPILLPVVGAGD
jgi:hypothetical protein